MRFTVHDSPDYYQLKVSVFNDDKKTELIGETWVALEEIIIPGGGQNDRWHHLGCKGRFAGEIRIEITYYDTRPKEEKMEEKRRETSVNGYHEQASEGIGGPRQPKQIKRRPLPADPTGSLDSRPTMPEQSHSLPATSTPPSKKTYVPNTQPEHLNQTADYTLNTTPPSNLRYQQLHDEDQGSPTTYHAHGQELHNRHAGSAPPNRHGPPSQHEIYDPENRQPNSMDWYQGTQEHQASNKPSPYQEEYCSSRDNQTQDHYHDYHQRNNFQAQRPEDLHARPSVQPLQDSSIDPEHVIAPLPQPHSMPDVRPLPILDTFSKQGHRYSLPNNEIYETPPRHNSLGAARDAWSSPIQVATEDESPPPPPTHRSTGLRSPPQSNERGNLDNYPPITAPAPLNIRTHRGNTSASPLYQVQSNIPHTNYPLSASPTSQVQSNVSQYGYPPSTSPSNSHQLSRSGASFSSHTSYSQPSRKQSQNNLAQSPTKDSYHALPPSLVPGYEPSIAEDESRRLLHERRMSNQVTYENNQNSQHQAMMLHSSQPEPNSQYQIHPARNSQVEQSPQYQSVPIRKPHPQTYPPTVSDNQTPLRQHEISQVRRAQQSSAPTAKPKATNSDPRTPTRKSVSPAPQTSAEKRTPTIPFSPDSYDTFNPSLSAASSINSRGSKYNTPEQAREALYESQKEARLSEGPIIGSDGRVIDPSDHLPTETWAPEPETKQPRKGPEVTLRFRHSPQGAQPMPSGARRPLREITARPHSISTPLSTNSPESNSLTSFGDRSRLQKKSGISPGQPASSPVVPTLHTAKSRTSMPRASASDYPMRENENYSYSNGSPIYARGLSDNNIPPPVPGKIPISAGRAEEEWDRSALSEEMKRIDIGVGGGQPRSRRNRFGG